MTLIIALNIIGCLGIVAVIVGMLAHSIWTQRRLETTLVTERVMSRPPLRPHPQREPRGTRRRPRPLYESS